MSSKIDSQTFRRWPLQSIIPFIGFIFFAGFGTYLFHLGDIPVSIFLFIIAGPLLLYSAVLFSSKIQIHPEKIGHYSILATTELHWKDISNVKQEDKIQALSCVAIPYTYIPLTSFNKGKSIVIDPGFAIFPDARKDLVATIKEQITTHKQPR